MNHNENQRFQRAAEALANRAYESEASGLLNFAGIVDHAERAGIFRYTDQGDLRGELIECEYVLTPEVIEAARVKLAALQAEDAARSSLVR